MYSKFINFKCNLNKDNEDFTSKKLILLKRYKESEQYKLDREKSEKMIKSILPKKYNWTDFLKISI